MVMSLRSVFCRTHATFLRLETILGTTIRADFNSSSSTLLRCTLYGTSVWLTYRHPFSLVPRPRFPTAAGGLHHRYVVITRSYWESGSGYETTIRLEHHLRRSLHAAAAHADNLASKNRSYGSSMLSTKPSKASVARWPCGGRGAIAPPPPPPPPPPLPSGP